MDNSQTNLLRERFLKDYEDWRRTGKEPSLASKDMRYYLDNNEKRLRDKGFSVNESFAVVEDNVIGNVDRSSGEYSATISYRELRHDTEYYKDGKAVKKFSNPETVYVTVLDKEGYEDFPCTCPNCGHRAMASELHGGCPYCGTVFEIDQTYPCVTSMYSVPGIVERKKFEVFFKKKVIMTGIFTGLVFFLIYFFTAASEYVIWFRILMSLFMGALLGALCAFLTYMVKSVTLLVKVFGLAGKSLQLLGGIGTKKKLTRYMEQSDPGYSFELFEGKIISLLRAIAFSDNRTGLSIYSGNDDLKYMDNLVDMQYRGAIQLKNFRLQDGMTKITLKAFMTDTYADKDRIKVKDENFEIECQRKSEGVFDLGFSVHAVKCRTCGGSFDAMHEKKCPFCGNEYDLVQDDWIITSVSRKK